MDGWGEPTGSYVHGYTPLELHRALDALAALKAVWSETAGSRLIFSYRWQPHQPTLYTSGNFTLGINTALSKTGAGRVIHAFFGGPSQDRAATVGDEQPWKFGSHPSGCGGAWAAFGLPLFQNFDWPGEEAGQPWLQPRQVVAWGDPTLCGLPRPDMVTSDPLEELIPVPLLSPLEEGGIFGWAYPLGAPAATMPRKNG